MSPRFARRDVEFRLVINTQFFHSICGLRERLLCQIPKSAFWFIVSLAFLWERSRLFILAVSSTVFRKKGVRSTGRPDIRPIHSRRYLSHPGFPRGSSQSGPRFCRCGCLWVKELGSASLLRRTSPARVASETRLSPVSRGPHGPAPWRRSRSVQKHRIVPLRPRFAIRRCPQSQANRHVQPTETRAQAQP